MYYKIKETEKITDGNEIRIYAEDISELVALDENYFRAKVAKIGKVNSNKRIYSEEVIESIVKKINDGKDHFGTLGNNEIAEILYTHISHKILNAWIEGDCLWCAFEILEDFPMGKVLRQLVNADINSIRMRLSGVGGGEFDLAGNYIVGKNYKLISINALPVKDAAAL